MKQSRIDVQDFGELMLQCRPQNRREDLLSHLFAPLNVNNLNGDLENVCHKPNVSKTVIHDIVQDLPLSRSDSLNLLPSSLTCI